jgi:hypothetical protein
MTESPPPSAVRRLIVCGMLLAGLMAAVAAVYSSLPGSAHPMSTGPTMPARPRVTADASTAPAPQPAPGLAPGPTLGDPHLSEGQPGSPDLLQQPPPLPPPPLLTGAVPDDASAAGRLVAGFPDVLPVAERSTVVASSVSSSADRVQAALEATTPRAAASVVEFYSEAFAASSLAGTPAEASGGSQSTVFALGDDSVTLTVTPEGTGARYSLFGVLAVSR